MAIVWKWFIEALFGYIKRNNINRRAAFYDEDDEEESALLTIFMYYVQVPSLLQIEILYENNR